MTASIYITSSEGFSGKQAVALGVLETLTQHSGRVGLFRPVTQSATRDDILKHLLERLDPNLGLTPELGVGVTYDEVHADATSALGKILQRYDAVASRCDVVVILGSDFTDVGNPAELDFNARVAANLGAPVLLVLTGLNPDDRSARTPAELAQVAASTLPVLEAEHAQLLAVVVNRVGEGHLDEVRTGVQAAVRDAEVAATAEVPVWCLPENKVLNAPSVDELRAALGAELYSGDEKLLGREVLGITVAGMSMEHVLERTFESGVVVVAADRTETIVALLLAQQARTMPSLAALVVNGPFEFSPIVESLIRGVDLELPMLRTNLGTYETAQRIVNTRGRFLASMVRKVDTALADFAEYVDRDALLGLLDVPEPQVVTPLMFEHTLLARARAERKHIVLPEGNDDRILQAASTLLTREVAELTILGDEPSIRNRASELGLDLAEAHIVSPQDPAMLERFSEEYARLRAHKGVTIDQARDRVQDVSYFGTMMVHLGLADGMVSGAAHTTAHTIKPSFEIVKTRPNVSIVSSVFLMSLADRVLVYGDCAVNPDPTAEQLADIAISSAETAKQFNIEPRVAMLSYSTGDSGAGADVDKVREATRLVRERAPELLVEGPLQYDAATDMAVASKKLPGSDVAGRATVFIFPDLNTGNNTYKAVQGSAGALAIGPVLQGLNKPINDLSRGALVSDIVNTVAITAIQAQADA
ncbi:phosphate acetyltransferase [Gulosibacter sp. ACHW.36C]|uniref:Phosphate acetyltransferase n=1 Tax=Gulosibacter sediminis TaxID=1729695 RepID=A0ABY4MZU9_9MICO|nr:phosphate acetyltransferase [Gulosibacter sediminis]UQN14518.1 phosphate acetyltransferase [Gulosibacter sediminis]